MYHVAPRYKHDPLVVDYRGGHPSYGVFVGPKALEKARKYAMENSRPGCTLKIYQLVEV